MLVKCETKSNRVKGLSFHPKLAWILASLHNGAIQLWDYRIGSLIDKFEEHEGPVRGVDFHASQPLFVSGGDDYRLKIWNYRQRRCIFTLLGHLDYIRTVQFHLEYPWILTASDDQTVRIWNWQNRSCIAVLTGHNHYVMCAQFHPRQDLVVSASLDQAIRVWDLTGLRDKTVSIAGQGPSHMHGHADMFGTSDAVCKFILEGHDRGVNWATFHPTMPLIASGADDRLIKLWRYNDTKAWEADTLRGHFNNVSCVLFHPKKELLLSNSEDRTIRVWDANKRTAVHTFRRENDRFWILVAHQNSNLVAVGHDSGMVVFKLDRERPPAEAIGTRLYYVKDRQLLSHDLASTASTSITTVRKPSNAMINGPRHLLYNHYNTAEVNVLLFYPETDVGMYELITCTLGANDLTPQMTKKFEGHGLSVAFVARNRFAVLEKSGAIAVCNLSNELSKKLEPPVAVERIFSADANKLLLKSEENLILFDLTSKKVLNEVTCPGVRYIVWSPDGNFAALLAKHNVLLVNKKLETLCNLHENIRVKGGAWDEYGAFIYSTLSHLKYALTNGDQGIIHSLIDPIYILRVVKQQMHFIDRQQNVDKKGLNCTEFLFKLALHQRQFNQVAMFIRNGRLCGNAVIGYLRQKGYPEVAMQFVDDPLTRFNLAIECGQLDEAMSCARTLDDNDVWSRLGDEALRQGKINIVENVYQKIKKFEKLSFLYLITGNIDKLKKMMAIAEIRKDFMSRFQNSLLLGDVEERVRILAEVGQLPLAALTAKVNGLVEYTAVLNESVAGVDFDNVMRPHPTHFVTPTPLCPSREGEAGNWPHIASPANNCFDSAMRNAESKPAGPLEIVLDSSPTMAGDEQDQWGNVGDELEAANIADAWDEGIDIKLESPAGGDHEPVQENSLTRGDRPQSRWLRTSQLAADQLAAGEFDMALGTLQKRIGLINAAPLKRLFSRVYQGSNTYLPGLPHTWPMKIPLLAEKTCLVDSTIQPARFFTPSSLLELLRECHRQVTDGRFSDALIAFQELLQAITLTATSDEESQVLEMIDVCRNYITGMRLEQARIDAQSDPGRALELMAYFTCCKMQPFHVFLVLRRAMGVAFTSNNYVTAATFARRLIQGNYANMNIRGAEEAIGKARKVLAACDQHGRDAHAINFEASDTESLILCSISLTRLKPGEATVKCPLCGSLARLEDKGRLCKTCDLSELGARVLGLQLRPLV